MGMRQLESEIAALEKESGWANVKKAVADKRFTGFVNVKKAVDLLASTNILDTFPDKINTVCAEQLVGCQGDSECKDQFQQLVAGWNQVKATPDKEACVDCIGKLIKQVYFQYDKNSAAQSGHQMHGGRIEPGPPTSSRVRTSALV